MEYPYKEYNKFVEDAEKAGYEWRHSEWDDAPFVICKTSELEIALAKFSVRCKHSFRGTTEEGYKIVPSKPASKTPLSNPKSEMLESNS